MGKAMTYYPEGVSVGGGRFRLERRLRGWHRDGLWLASDRQRNREVWVTIRRFDCSEVRRRKFTFHALGIAAPLYVGPPDLDREDGEEMRNAHCCIVDEIPEGDDLASVGRLSYREAIQLGCDLCDVVADWASADGYILRGLRPETIFVSKGSRRFTGATPRPLFLLGNQNEFDAYPSLSFDPPPWGPNEFDQPDAVFIVALLIWWALTGIHPYVIPGTDTERNELDDRRLPFDGPAPLGDLLERALVADRATRIGLDRFRAELAQL
jgi:hypothetical protein